MTDSTSFSKVEGQVLAQQVANYIAENEPFHNVDECINEIRLEVNKIINSKCGGMPVSDFIDAEIIEHIKCSRSDESHYKVKLRPEVNLRQKRIPYKQFMASING